jgi:glycosyltransferase involved in cell wall biosynthesis
MNISKLFSNKKLKIAISTISKNEVDNVKDFVNSCKEADLVSIVDTGSTDGTIDLLKKLKVYSGQKIIEPFDFSEARNFALNKLPNDIDIVVSIDMDERLKPGWREELEKSWKSDTESMNYTYISDWQDKEKTKPGVSCWRSKIFKRHGYKWFNNVHELPLPIDKHSPVLTNCENIVVYHYQKGDRNYISLLNESIKNNSNELNSYIQRGSDYMKQKEYLKGISDYEKYIELAKIEQKKCQSSEMEFYKLLGGQIAHSYIEIGRAKLMMKYPIQDVLQNMLRAVSEAPDMREAWVYLADAWMSIGNYGSAYAAAMNALRITQSGVYAKELICWGEYPKKIADSSFAKIISGVIFENSVNQLK